jgi:hypothetical protein
MQTIFRVLRTTGSPSEHMIDLPQYPTWAELRSIVMPHIGAAMMHVRVFDPEAFADPSSQMLDLFVDEVGTLKGLPFNVEATKLVRNVYLDLYPDDCPERLPQIAGDAVLFMRLVIGGRGARKASQGVAETNGEDVGAWRLLGNVVADRALFKCTTPAT